MFNIEDYFTPVSMYHGSNGVGAVDRYNARRYMENIGGDDNELVGSSSASSASTANAALNSLISNIGGGAFTITEEDYSPSLDDDYEELVLEGGAGGDINEKIMSYEDFDFPAQLNELTNKRATLEEDFLSPSNNNILGDIDNDFDLSKYIIKRKNIYDILKNNEDIILPKHVELSSSNEILPEQMVKFQKGSTDGDEHVKTVEKCPCKKKSSFKTLYNKYR